MIIKASARGSPMGLARHLLNDKDNDHVELHSVRGFVSEDLSGAMREVHAMSAAVKSKQPLFSLSLSPPVQERAEVGLFESVANRILERMGLQDQPHALVFHEKEGRRHAHLVVSRIDAEHGRVVPLPHFKRKLFELSKEVYLDQGWDLPKGFIDQRDRDPLNYDLVTYQQAKREGLDPAQIKLMAKEAWAITEDMDQAAFAKELEKRGLYLAKGDRRGHVAVTWRGEVHALPRLLDCKTKQVRERLGEPKDLRSVDDTRDHIRTVLEPVMGKMMDEADQSKTQDMAPLDQERAAMTTQHRLERERLDAGQKARQETEAKDRATELRKGIGGLWDRISGRYRQTKAEHERQAYEALQRDRAQRQAIVEAQLAERQKLQQRINEVRQRHAKQLLELHNELYRLREPVAQTIQQEQSPASVSARQAWLEQQRERQQPAEQTRERGQSSLRAEWLRTQQDRTRSRNERDNNTGMERDLG